MKKFLTCILLVAAVNSHAQVQADSRMADDKIIDQSGFKNMRTFYGGATLQLPPGTSRILVEVWGAGAGGSTVGGGGGGAYGKALINVAPGTKLMINVGMGGRGGEKAIDGQNSSVNYAPPSNPNATYSFVVQGGKSSAYAGMASRGDGGPGATATGSTEIGFISKPGEDARLYEDDYQQSGPNTFVVTRHIGNGGNAGNTTYTGGRGSVVINSSPVSYIRSGNEGKVPGGGGGGGHLGGFNGANGMVIIYY